MHLLAGQLLPQLELLLLHLAQLILLVLEAELHVQSFAAVAFPRRTLGASPLHAPPLLSRSPYVSKQKPLGSLTVPHKIEGERRPKRI